MREYKFRAWDKIYKRMFDVHGLTYKEGEILAWRLPYDFEDVTFSQKGILVGKNCEIMQYTGLKDRYGVAIYEGDILLTFTSYSKNEFYKNEYYEVVWDENAATFVFAPTFEKYADDFYSLDNEGNPPTAMMVYGNIYENPELLEDAQ